VIELAMATVAIRHTAGYAWPIPESIRNLVEGAEGMAAIAETASAWAPRVRSILRIAAGLLILEHGTSKLLGFPQSEMSGLSVTTLFGAAGVFELIGGALIVIGLFTRPAAFILSGMCAVAYWSTHAPQGFFPFLNGGELAALYSFVFLYFAFAGGGPWSVDAARGRA
jgi:putative oxidoreductase